ncbi:hypothetical protein OUY22_11190 [Nonomuraea sp. MCN248]|uniref:Tetratricopeptide repeat protein n=1 Tax=Nonomuraea corallina TaxID=2989783 RepID=A0ABT4S9V0_9ACTN|nr:hypothetical protein [Nonomuraea corallina]MDA0633982.1 hypothetical protein [Nonomuraea corallina]
MDGPPRDSPCGRIASEHVVEVRSGPDGLAEVTGTGYVVAPGLVLTSAHLVDPGVPCHVRGGGSRAAAEPVWRGHGSLAAALLRVSAPDSRTSPGPPAPWAGPIGPVRWGRVTGDAVRCAAHGAGTPTETVTAGTVAVRAVVSGGGGVGSVRPVVELSGSPPGSLAGAALLAEPTGHLVGVLVSWDGDGHADVVPAGALWLDDGFRSWLEDTAAPVEDVSGSERVVLLPGLLEPAAVEPPQGCPDWSLPAARHAVVPFVGRKAELAALRTWAAGPEPLSVALITGPGGSGKSRLAVELCRDLSAAGWDAGVVPAPSLMGPLSDPAARLDALRPTLLVLDFPEPSAALAAELARRLAGHRHNPRVRLLLVARASAGVAPPSAGWWRRLDTAAGGRLKRLVHTTIRLEDHPLTLPERAEHAAAAIRAYATRPAPGRPAGTGDALDRIRPFPLDDPLYAVPLRVHLAALMRVRGHAIGPGDELVHRFLTRERERWSTSPDAPDAEVAGIAVALAVLTAPSPGELRVLLSVVPGMDDKRTAGIATWATGLFETSGEQAGRPHGTWTPSPADVPGGASGAWAASPVDVPDLVVGQLLEETAGLEALVLAVHDHPGRTAAHLARMLDVLRLGADQRRVRAALRSLVVHRLNRMLAEAASGPGEQLLDRIDAALRLLRSEPEVARAVAALPPWQAAHPWVRPLKVTLAEMRVERLRDGKRADLATALTTSSAWLAAVGRLPEAVAAAGKAAELFAAAPPYEQAENHAEALFNQAACLLLSGVPEQAVRPAREAVARFGILAEEDPRYGPHAERARYNLACALAGTGRLREAVAGFRSAGGDQQTVDDLETVLGVLPGPSPSASPSASLSASPSASPSRSAGFPAATDWSAGFASGLLSGVGGALGPLDERDARRLPRLGARLAVYLVGAVRGVAVTDQEVCRRLYRLGARLERQGWGEAAAVVAEEAVVRLRGIAAEEPGLRTVLAAAAGLVSRVRGERAELEAAMEAAGEAVENLRALVVLEPGRHRRELAERLRELGEYLLARRRPGAALDVLRESVWVADGLSEGPAERAGEGPGEGANERTGERAGEGAGRLVVECRRSLGACLVELGRAADGLAQFETAAGLLGGAGEQDARLLRDLAGWIRRAKTPPGRTGSYGGPVSATGVAGERGWEASRPGVELRSPGGERFARGDVGGALEAVDEAMGALPEETTPHERLLVGTPFLVRALEVRPLPRQDVLRTLLDDLAGHLDGPVGEPALLGPLAAFADVFTREVPVSAAPGLHAALGECLERYAVLTGEAAAAEAAVRVFQGLATAHGEYRERLGVAFAVLARIEHELARPVPATLERAADLLTGSPEQATLAGTLTLYGDTLLAARRPVEALTHLERAADLCDELDEPAVAAAAYAGLAAALAALDRPRAALEAVAWSMAEQERMPAAQEAVAWPPAGQKRMPAAQERMATGRERMPAGRAAARARADEVRGRVLRRMGRRREALAHLVEAVDRHRALPRTPARRLAAAEVAVVIVDDLLADGRAEEAVEYAVLAVDGYAAAPSARLKHALAKQRLVRCHLMRGALGEAAPLVEELIVDARRASRDLTYRAVLADSLAQSAELLTVLRLDDGPRAEARARESVRLYDELIAAGMAAQGVHAGRAGANLSLAAALGGRSGTGIRWRRCVRRWRRWSGTRRVIRCWPAIWPGPCSCWARR